MPSFVSCDLMSSGDVLEVLRPYCSESTHSADTRRTLLLLMEKVVIWILCNKLTAMIII